MSLGAQQTRGVMTAFKMESSPGPTVEASPTYGSPRLLLLLGILLLLVELTMPPDTTEPPPRHAEVGGLVMLVVFRHAEGRGIDLPVNSGDEHPPAVVRTAPVGSRPPEEEGEGPPEEEDGGGGRPRAPPPPHGRRSPPARTRTNAEAATNAAATSGQ